MQRPIYLDHHATTPLAPEVLEAMRPYLEIEFGNASSRGHVYGEMAADAVARARAQVADSIGARSEEIVFTSGATEADNLAVLGGARARRSRGRHVITCATEHVAVLDPVRQLEREGFESTVLGVDASGVLDPADVVEAVRPDTVLISLMLGNNEIGTLHPIADIARAVRGRGEAAFHCDATQALARVPLDVETLGVDFLSLTAHKAYGPKGVGALYVRGGPGDALLEPLFHGGGQEGRLRPGTYNTAGIVGLGSACSRAARLAVEHAPRIATRRERLLTRLRAAEPDLVLHGDPERRVAGNLNLRFPGLLATDLRAALPELAFSAGAACHSGAGHPSHVLEALGIQASEALGAVRLGLGSGTTDEEIERAGDLLVEALRALRGRASGASSPSKP